MVGVPTNYSDSTTRVLRKTNVMAPAFDARTACSLVGTHSSPATVQGGGAWTGNQG